MGARRRFPLCRLSLLLVSFFPLLRYVLSLGLWLSGSVSYALPAEGASPLFVALSEGALTIPGCWAICWPNAPSQFSGYSLKFNDTIYLTLGFELILNSLLGDLPAPLLWQPLAENSTLDSYLTGVPILGWWMNWVTGIFPNILHATLLLWETRGRYVGELFQALTAHICLPAYI